ncbi:arylesterase [Ulvibacterium sp.]|uniref:arylesterase n=1 Tax=Ulvibacterium sp. TaxID=2665914 RepID=UPI003CC62D60
MHTLLKLCYFFSLFLLLSCGGKSTQKTDDAATEPVDSPTEEISKGDSKTIVFFGDSLTAGLGLDPQEAFPAVIQDTLNSLGMNYTVINSGLSGETTASGRNRLDWVLNQKADIFILELGANDGLRGIPLAETRTNLQAIIDVVRQKNPNTQIILAGMQIPPNMGQDYTSEFRKIFPDLAEKNTLPLIPFLLEGVAGNPELNQEDGIHPTVAGQKIVANNVWAVLEDVVRE